MKPMLLLHSQSFPHYGLDRFFEFAKKAGFDGVEIAITDNFDTQNVEYLKRLEGRYGVPIKSFSMPQNLEEKVFEAFQKTVKEFPNTILNLSMPQSFAFRYKKWMENVVPKLAAKYDLKVNYRNVIFQMSFGIIPDRIGNSLYTLRETGRICLDLSALWSSKQEIMRTIDFLGESLKSVYLSNVHKSVPYSRLETGVLPIESFLTKLSKQQFQGHFILKLSPKSLHEGEDENLLQALKESKEFFEKYFEGKTDASV